AAAASLEARTELSVPPRVPTSIITVFHDGYSKERAQKTNEAILQALQDFHTSKYANEDFQDTVRENLDDLTIQIKNLDTEIREHSKECGFQDIENQRAAFLNKISMDKLAMSDLEVKIRGLESQLEATNLELEDVEPMIDTVIPAVLEVSPEYTAHQDFVMDLVRRYNEKVAMGGQDRNLLALMQENIDEQREVLAGMEKLVEVKPAQTEPKPNTYYNELIMRRSDVRGELAGARSSLEELTKHVQNYEAQVLRMGECLQFHKEKTAELETLQDERVGVSKLLQASESHQELTDKGYSALQLLSDATHPRSKTGPNRAKPMGMGVMAGLALGFLIAMLRQLLDPTVRYRETVEKDLDSEVLVVVPEARALRRIKPGHVKVG
ncbi:MAG: hypothetical protein KDB61_07205, partial [Planctomycetes bacterium]|nr:hypothetical protein [Planctomycetota bacterium]